MADTTPREVNSDETEILNLEEDDTTTPEGDEDEDLEEVVIPPVDEETPEGDEPATEEEPAAVIEEAPDSSPEGAAPDAPPATVPSQPAPVPGETPREKALRLEVQRVKGLLRVQGIQQLVTPEGDAAAPAKPVSDRIAKLKETYSDEEIAAMEEAVDAIAESRGYVKKSENYQESVNTVVNDFIQANPEYKPENDPEDVRWTRFQELLTDGTYNIQGKTPEQLKRIFTKVSEDVVKELGAPANEAAPRQQAAQRQKIRSVSHSGGTRTPAAPKESKVDPSVRSMFKDFDDEDLTED